MLLSMKGEIPSKENYHDPELKNKENKTVCYYLWNNGIEVPNNW